MRGSCEIQVRSRMRFSCSIPPDCFSSNSYRFSHIARTMRALQTSVKTSLRIDNEGLLSLQFLMPSSTPRMNPVGVTSNFIEFRVRLLFDSFCGKKAKSFQQCLALEEDP